MDFFNKSQETTNNGLSEVFARRAQTMIGAADYLIAATNWSTASTVSTAQTFEQAVPPASTYPNTATSTTQAVHMQPEQTATTNAPEATYQNPLFSMSEAARDRIAQIHEGTL